MGSNLPLLLAFGIGVITGLRAMTGIAVVSWFASARALALQGTPLAFLGSTPAVIVFTLGAIAELVVDKLPNTQSRKKPPGFIARIVMGGLTGTALALGGHCSPIGGAILGVLGAVAGTLGGHLARTRSVKALHTRDFPIALSEDAIAVLGALLIVSLV